MLLRKKKKEKIQQLDFFVKLFCEIIVKMLYPNFILYFIKL